MRPSRTSHFLAIGLSVLFGTGWPAQGQEAPAVELPGRAWEVSTPQDSASGRQPAPAQQASASVREPMQLPHRSGQREPAAARPKLGSPPIATVAGSLAVVCGLFLGLAWLWRTVAPRHYLPLPKSVLCSLGRTSLPPRHTLHLIQLGNKLVLVATGNGQIQPLAEVTDPQEVARLCGLCEQQRTGSITSSFRQVLSQMDDLSGPPRHGA
ncbi:MAG: hypothetical protein KatS3mg110_3129 [Pirellulaceae bacterium]|nr:MAG: hypothetical protein KatS3mg110_3129 [Pirellulaceae bacterium]